MRKSFSIAQAALFFDRSPAWVRWHEEEGRFVREDGTPILPERVKQNKLWGGGDRRYTLDMLREMAHSLRRNEFLSNPQLIVIIQRLDAFRQPVFEEKK